MAKRIKRILHTGDCWLDLLGAAVILATIDAQKGDVDAQTWLQGFAPDVAYKQGLTAGNPPKAEASTQWAT